MHYFLDNFGDRLAASLLIGFGTVAGMAVVGVKAKRAGNLLAASVARVGAVGFALAAIAATGSNGIGWAGGFQGFQWSSDGLNAWRSDLASFPDSVQSVLLVGNVVAYIPMGICVAIAWPRRAVATLAVASLVPAGVELLRPFALRGLGSIDDFIQNALGIVVGWSIAMIAWPRFPRGGPPNRVRHGRR